MILSRDGAGAILMNGAACPGAPSVTNTDIVYVEDGGSPGAGITVEIDLANGGFVGGMSPEGSGTSEIEFQLDISGSAGNDSITGGGGVDAISAGLGMDGVFVRDGISDIVFCGGDSDTVETDAAGVHTLDADCETPLFPQLPGGGSAPTATPVTPVDTAAAPKKCRKGFKLKRGKCKKKRKK